MKFVSNIYGKSKIQYLIMESIETKEMVDAIQAILRDLGAGQKSRSFWVWTLKSSDCLGFIFSFIMHYITS